MLFDLRGSGRRRTVKIVYVTLAFLMGGGLVLFGIGGGGALSGGLVDAFQDGGGSGSGAERQQETERAAEAKATANPDDATAWAELARARFNLANSGDNIDVDGYTESGAKELQAATAAWEKHLDLAGNKPDPNVASVMVQAYYQLNDLVNATVAQEVIAQDRKSAGAYTTLAQTAYQAGQLRKGDLARDKALKLTEPDERETLRGRLKELRAQAVAAAASATQQAQDE